MSRAKAPVIDKFEVDRLGRARAITSNIAGVSFSVEAVDIQGDRHLRVGYVDRISRVLLGGYERYSVRGHSLVHQQKVGCVFRPAFTVRAVAGVALVADASEYFVAHQHARCIRRTEARLVHARELRVTRETVAVVALEATKITITFLYLALRFAR